MTVSELAEKLSLAVITMPDGNREIKGGYSGDLLSWVMSNVEEGNVWITIMNNINVVAVASLSDVSCVVFAESVMPDEEAIKTASEKGINMLSCDKSSFELSGLIHCLLKG